MNLSEYHHKFPDSVQWRVTPDGVEVYGQGLITYSDAALKRAKTFMNRYGDSFLYAAVQYHVPVEILVACALTEADIKEPETCFRKEPGYISDEKTPHRISVGLCQMLISTARQTMRCKDIDRPWLYNPDNSILACASYMRDLNFNWQTGYDPIYSACAYNAGGLYEQKGRNNRWKLRQYPIGTGRHADRFAEYFGAVMQLTKDRENWKATSIRNLLGATL